MPCSGDELPVLFCVLFYALGDACVDHCVTGESLVRSPDPHATAICLVGEWAARHGVVVSVTSFIEDAQRVVARQQLRVVCFLRFVLCVGDACLHSNNDNAKQE